MFEERSRSYGTLLASFSAGAALGVSLAMLCRPRTHPRTGQVAGATKGSVDRMKQYVRGAELKFKTSVEEGRESINQKRSLLMTVLEAGKAAMRKEKERLAQQKMYVAQGCNAEESSY